MVLVRVRDETNLHKYRNQDLRIRRRDHYRDGREMKIISCAPSPAIGLIKARQLIQHCGALIGPGKSILSRFVTFRVPVRRHPYNFSVVGFDVTHSQHHISNGVILSRIGRDGDGLHVMLTAAFMNMENKHSIS